MRAHQWFVIPAVLVGLALSLWTSPAQAGGDWNDKGVAWQSYDDGLKAAQTSKKPVCLIFYTEWCPHCTNYSKLFHDAKVVEQSKNFVMVRLDKDKNKELSKKYAPDGEYIPRTYFLTSAGVLDADLHEQRPNYKYFYNESDASGILGGMSRALAKLK